MSTLEEIAKSLPQAKPVKIPWSEYKASVERSLKEKDCALCHLCSEPIWKHNPIHVCHNVQLEYLTEDVMTELSNLTTK